MTSDDTEQVPSSLADISQKKIENIATKIWEDKSLNADDRQTIYFALMGEWEPLFSFRKTRGPKPKGHKYRALAEDVERIENADELICDHMADLGKKHQLPGLEDVSRDTFNKCLNSGRKALATYKQFKETRRV